MDVPATILTGVVSGVASGLVLTIVLWGWRKCHGRRERRDQIKYVAELIHDARQRVLCPATHLGLLNTLLGEENSVTEDQLSNIHYERFRFDLSSALSGRCTRLTYDEVAKISEIFLRDRELVPPNHAFSRKSLRSLFRKAESIKELGLKPLEC